MESQEKKSKWDELARELGAEIPAENEHPMPASPETFDEPATHVEERAARPKLPAPKRGASDWAKLTSDLGLPPIEEPATPASVPPVARQQSPSGEERTPPPRPSVSQPPATERETQRNDSDREESHRGDRPRRSRGSRGGSNRNRNDREPRGERSSRGGRERRPARDDAPPQGGDPQGEHEHRGRDHRERREPRERRPREEVEAENRPTIHRSEPMPELGKEAQPEPVAAREPAPKPSAGVSLWHKIFGMPAEQTAKLTEAEERRRDTDETDEYLPRSRGPGSEEVRFTTEANVDEIEAEFVDAEAREDSPEGENRPEGEGEDERPRRPRRRRRGGRGRGSRSSEGSEQTERGGERASPAEREDRRERAPRAEPGSRGRSSNRRSERNDRGRSSRQVEDAGSPDDEFDDLDDIGPDDSDIAEDFGDDERGEGEAVRAGSRSRSSAGHRSIPSWDEAIGMIVDTNLEARPQRRRSNSSPRSSSQRGGRPRGGRYRGGRSGGSRSNGGNRSGDGHRHQNDEPS